MNDMEQSSESKYAPYKWQMNELLQFLELYKEAECLWNTNAVDYKNKNRREECLEVIRNKLAELGTNVTVQDIKNKIKSIRTTYSDELNKIMRSSMSQNEYKPKVYWFKFVDSFLHGFTDNRGNTKSKNKITGNIGSASIKRFKVKHFENIRNIESSQSETSHGDLNNILNSISRLEKLSTQILETEDEYDLFGRSIALHLKKLPEHAGFELMQKIQGLVTNTRIFYSQNHGVPAMNSEEQEYDNNHAEVLIDVPH